MKRKYFLVMLFLFFLIILIVGGIWFHTNREKKHIVYTKLEDGTWELTTWQSVDDVCDIPAERWGKPVTKIGIRCFQIPLYQRSRLQVNIPETVVEIDSDAFIGCKNISFAGGEMVKKIGAGAFGGCTFASDNLSLKNLTYIDQYAFYETDLKAISYGNSLKYIGQSAFYGADMDEISIPDSVEYIGHGAFAHTPWIDSTTDFVVVRNDILLQIPNQKKVILPDGIKVISISERHIPNDVNELYISDTVEEIIGYILYEAKEPTTIYIPSSVINIEECGAIEKKNLVGSGGTFVTYVVEAGSYGEEYANEMAALYGSKVEVVAKISYPH